MSSLTLTGLDAQNPLAFLAALGLLRVLDSHASQAQVPAPRLSFIDEGQITPRLSTPLALDEVIAIVLGDAAQQADNVALQLAYDDKGALVSPGASGATRDLKPSPAGARDLLARAATAGPRASRLAAAFFSELVQDNKGNSKPTAFHFTAGQQAFLEMTERLRRGITADDVREALVGPWRNTSTLPSLTWDASVTRLYALRAGNPSLEKRGSVPAANWLGVLALEFFPVVVTGGARLTTTGVVGGWKDSVFRWPVWEPALTAPTVAGLLRTPASRWTPSERTAMGITGVFASKIARTDQGGYGSFSPAEVVLPASARR